MNPLQPTSSILLVTLLSLARALGCAAPCDSTKTVIRLTSDQPAGAVIRLYQPSALTGKDTPLATSTINNAGQGVLTIQADQVEFATLSVREQLIPLCLVPRSTLQLEMKTQAASTQVAFTGESAKASEFVYRSGLLLNDDKHLQGQAFLALGETEFFDRISQLSDQYEALFEAYRDNTYLDEAILSLLRQRNQMQLLRCQYQYVQAKFDFTALSAFQDNVVNRLRTAATQPVFLLQTKAIEPQQVLNAYLQLFVNRPISARFP